MGIPSYFSYIIKNYPNILKKFQKNFSQKETIFNNLFLDSNSIIYDSMREIEYKNNDNNTFERNLISAVCKKIEDYIQQISPNELVYIAFDGVAPFAKIDQQKTRRYRSWYESSLLNKMENKEISEITTSMFTPGTEFMKKLSVHIKQKFLSKEFKEKSRVKEIVVATPEQAGEGEHKLYEHLRKNPLDETKHIAVYGLDADLIMLSLFHLTYCPNIYIVREAPSFAHVLINEDKDNINPDEPLFLESKIVTSVYNKDFEGS